MINTRSELTNLLQENSIGCELGVFRGDFSQELLNSKKFSTLYLVDPFEGQIESGDKDGNNIQRFSGEDLFNMVKGRFSPPICEVRREDSLSFLERVPSKFFDFIYIDTNHQYDQTVRELNLALLKIKDGGFICGHDYSAAHFYGVYQAVNEFAEKTGLLLQVASGDNLPSYFFKIPL